MLVILCGHQEEGKAQGLGPGGGGGGTVTFKPEA